MADALDVNELQEHFSYQENGVLVRKLPTHPHYTPIGRELRGTIGKGGYRVLKFRGRTLMFSRVVWAVARGEPVPPRISFADGNPDNTRIENLRG